MAITPVSDTEHLQRLLHGMARCVSTKGYGATTIADIVSEAAVSRRTFYEHFATKADCLMALYESVSLDALSVLKSQVKPDVPWRDQVQDALTDYFGWMAKNPVLMRALFIDILALGADGLKVRRRMHQEIAEFISETVNNARLNTPALSGDLIIALVGGIHELVLHQSEKSDVFNVAELVQISANLVCRVFAESDGNTID
jgi:AcrR family transcriptional regulator